MGAFAWVTLATNDSYSLGALVLAHSLKQSGTAHQLAVLVTPGVTSAMRDKLASVFNVVQEVNILDSRDEANLRLLKRPELGITFTKLHCWRLTQFEKCVFLDADTLVLQNADELFEREELSAAPDVGWPDCFNSGVFVYRPSLDTYEKLIQFALEKGSFDGGDQGLLNLFFADWAHKDINKHLPFIYNVCSTACYSYLPAFKQFGGLAKIIHFIGTQKPWLQYFNTETRRVQPSGDSSHLQDVLQRWWDIFCSLIHPHLSPAMQGQSQHGMSPSYITPQYDPPPYPTASADDFENSWDPWDEYAQKIAQNPHTSEPIRYDQIQPHESPNTNASRVANQPIIHSQPQSHNCNTYSVQNNSYYQPPPSQEFHHVPTSQSQSPVLQQNDPSTTFKHSEPQDHSEPHYHQLETQHYHHESHYQPSQPDHHEHEPHDHSESYQHHHHEPQHHHFEHHHPQHHEPEYHESKSHPHHESQHFHIEPRQHEISNDGPYHHHGYSHSHEYQHYESNHSHDHSYNNAESVHNRESYSHTPERPRSPNGPDQFPVLPKECEATTTVSNDMSLSSTIEDCSKQENAGLAGAFSQLTLGVARTPEQDALESILRKQAWEVGNIDYLGKDSFENIWSKISETLSAGPSPPEVSTAAPPKPTTPSLPQACAAPPEPEIAPAPVESQSQTALQEEASTVQPQAALIGSATDKVDSSQSTSPVELKERQVSEAPIVISGDQTGKLSEPTETNIALAESTVADPTSEVSNEAVPLISAGGIEGTERNKSESSQVSVEQKPDKEPLVCQLPAETTKTQEAKGSNLQPTTEKLPVETSVPASAESKQSASTASTQPVQTKIEELAEASPTPKLEADISFSSSVTSESSTVTSPLPTATSITSPSAKSSESSDTPGSVAPPVAERTGESSTKPVAVASKLDTSDGAVASPPEPKKVSPKTKVTAATPPATPDSPPAEKTKQAAPVGKAKEALTAEASVPDTPPPTEGGSTPTPPPRKTDKPKKAAPKTKK